MSHWERHHGKKEEGANTLTNAALHVTGLRAAAQKRSCGVSSDVSSPASAALFRLWTSASSAWCSFVLMMSWDILLPVCSWLGVPSPACAARLELLNVKVVLRL